MEKRDRRDRLLNKCCQDALPLDVGDLGAQTVVAGQRHKATPSSICTYNKALVSVSQLPWKAWRHWSRYPLRINCASLRFLTPCDTIELQFATVDPPNFHFRQSVFRILQYLGTIVSIVSIVSTYQFTIHLESIRHSHPISN